MPFTTPFVVSPYDAGDNEVRPAVTRLPNGQLVVIYEHYNGATNSFGIRIINPDGTPVTSEIFEVIGGYGAMPRVTAIDATHFAVVVADYGTATGAVEMIARVYTINGGSISHSGDLPISNPASLDDDNGNDHQIVRLEDGNYLVVWAQFTGNFTGAQIVARTFDANFNPLTPETRISEFNNMGVSNPLVTVSGHEVVVSWSQNNPLDGGNIHARMANFVVGIGTGALPASPPNDIDLGAHTVIRSLIRLANQDVLVLYVGGPVSGGALDDGDVLTARIYSPDMSTVKATMQVNDVVDDNGVSTVSAVAFPWGGFQVIWSQDPTGGTGPSSDFELFSRAYNNTYAPDGGPVQLTSNATSDYDPVAVLDGVNVTVTWAQGNASGGGTIVGLYLTHQDPDAPNIAPSGADATLTLAEDGEHVFTAADFGFSDVDHDEFGGIVITTVPGAGSIVLTDGDGLVIATATAGAVVTAADIAAGLVRFRPAPDASGGSYASFTFQIVDDGGVANAGVDTDQSPNTITFDVTAVNDAPFVDLNGDESETGTTVAYTENGAAVVLAPDAVLSDVDGANLTGATVTISGGMVALHDYLTVGGAASGTTNGVTFSYNPFTGVLTLSGLAPRETYQDILRTVGFDSTSDAPGASRTISWTVNDGFATSSADTTVVTITSTNDAPTGSVSITGTVAEDETLTADVSALADAEGLGTMHYDWQRDTGSGFVSIGAADQATYTLGDADVGAVIRVVASYTDGDGTAESATSAGTTAVANAVDDAATAVDDADATTESAVLTGSVVANDTDIDGPAFVISAVNGSAAAVGTQITLPSGALLTLDADGTYSYDPNGAFDGLSGTASGGTNLTATDSFTYTLANGNTATVTLTIIGEDSEGDDVVGDSGDNTLDAGDGDDVIVGGAGDDTLNGGDGVDTADYQGASARVVIKLNAGVASDDGDGGSDTLHDIENLTGSAFNDILVGAAGGNELSGGAGSDTLVGLDGNDVLRGGTGAANQLQGGTGDDDYYVDANDTVIELLNQGHDRIFTTRDRLTLVANVEELHYTGAGNFIGTGNALNNTITGGAGADVIYGAGGNDSLNGGAGSADTLTYANAAGGVNASLFHGTAFNDGDGGVDTLAGFENLTGSVFDDGLLGDNGVNVVAGGAGDDVLIGFGGDDTLLGGVGIDTVAYGASMSGVTVRLDRNTAQDGFGGTDTIVAVENVVGSTQDDLIIGNGLDNRLDGGAGRDTLMGQAGNDVLVGGIGAANTLYGGEGDDLYIVEANDTLVELAGQGTDSVQTTRTQFVLGAHIENLAFTGWGNFAGTGNASNNVITGGDGLDTLVGGGGDDTLIGGLGRDLAQFSGLASQYVLEALGGGQYRVTDTVGGRDGVDILNGIENVRFADGVVVLADFFATGAPLLSAKDAGAQVSPTLSDDAFVLPTDLVLPQVLPQLDGFADAPSAADFGMAWVSDWMPVIHLDGAMPDLGDHRHDDWML